MPEERSGPPHILQIWVNPEGGDQIDVFHPTGCDDGCPIVHYVGEWWQETVRDFGRGTHRVEMWAVPPGWAGTEPTDGDGGIRTVDAADSW